MALYYTPEFKRALRKLSRRYRSLRVDLRELLSELESGKNPGDQLQDSRYFVFKARVKIAMPKKGRAAAIASFTTSEVPIEPSWLLCIASQTKMIFSQMMCNVLSINMNRVERSISV